MDLLGERMYSIKEVAGIFGVSRDTVTRWIAAGLMGAWVMPVRSNKRKRVYKTRRISESEVKRFRWNTSGGGR